MSLRGRIRLPVVSALAVAFLLTASPGAHAQGVTPEGWRSVMRQFVEGTLGKWWPGARARNESSGTRPQDKGFLIDPNGNPIPAASGQGGTGSELPSATPGGQA